MFIHAACEGTGSSAVLSSLTSAMRLSNKYALLAHLSDYSGVDPVLTIYLNCAEGGGNIAVASNYGVAKCVKGKCIVSIDGSSIRAALCGRSSTKECGNALFSEFNDYVARHR